MPRRLSLALVALVFGTVVPVSTMAATGPYDPFFAPPQQLADLSTIAPTGTTANRAYGVAAGDYDGDGDADLIVGRTDGRVYRMSNNGNGTFATPVAFAWKLETFNAWTFAAADVTGDGKLDLVYGSNAQGADSGLVVRVNDGDVRYLTGLGDGNFSTATNYVRSGITFNAGTLVADVGTDTSTVVAGDVDGDGDADIVAGTVDGTNAAVKLLRNSGGGSFAAATSIISQTQGCSSTTTTTCTPTYFPPQSSAMISSPWGLALGDADGDGDRDLWVGDRALYVYLYTNSGAGAFTQRTGNSGLPAGRENAYIDHDSFRPSTGFTPALASADFSGDNRADLAVGLLSSTQTTTTTTANDGTIVFDISKSGVHATSSVSPDFGTAARSVAVGDVNNDGALDLVSGTAEGRIFLLRQLPPLDSDGDGVSDYVDNAPNEANAPRLDMNTDGTINYRDQLDNDFDTVLGDPEIPASWQRNGDPADSDDDNDGVADGADSCRFRSNADQADADGDGRGDACDPLDQADSDGDGVPDGPLPGDPLYEEHQAAAMRWSEGTTKFVLRNDALSRIFQNEFTQLLTDAAVLSPADWAAKCWQNYGPGGDDPADPCGTGEGTPEQTLTLAGGMEVPMSLVVIPRLLWTDAPVVDWINDRNSNPRLEIGQHGTYHPDNTGLGDWAGDPAKGHFACETCGFSLAEMVQLLNLGRDALLGNYANAWLAQSGATAGSAKIDWSDAAHPLISYAAPFNTSDAVARDALGLLGFRAFSASQFEENPNGTGYGEFFADNPSSMERFGPSGMFHVSADWQIDPPDHLIADGDYSAADRAAYESYLISKTEAGGLNTWLIEEVEWGGRACNDRDRLVDCNGSPNRENNTVYLPRWQAWIHLLEYVRNHEDSVVLTMGEVALARAFDNAPTVANADQADGDHDGVGDAIDGATLTAAAASLSRNVQGSLSATLLNGAGQPIAGQMVTFEFDADGDAAAETYTATTDADGIATVAVTPTRPVGPATFSAVWDGLRASAGDPAGVASVSDSSALQLDASNPSQGEAGEPVIVGATLVDSDGNPLSGMTLHFAIDDATNSGTTDADGHASVTLTLVGPGGETTLDVDFAGGSGYGQSSDSAPFTVHAQPTSVTLDASNPASGQVTDSVTFGAALLDSDGDPLAGQTLSFTLAATTLSATTDVNGHATATFTLNGSAGSTTLTVAYAGDTTYASSGAARAFTISKEDTILSLSNAVATSRTRAIATATLREADGAPLAGKTIQFQVEDRVRGRTVWTAVGTAVTNASGVATREIPANYVSKQPRPIRAVFAGDPSFLGSTGQATTYRQ